MPYKFSKTFSWSLRGYAFASAVMIFLFGGSLFLRVSPVFEYHHTAWRIWPWDVHWTEYFIETELIHRHLDHAQTIADYRLRIWPYDPSSHIGQGLVAMYRNQSEDALLNFQKGLHQVRNGRCTWEASQRLTQFMRLPTTSVELKIAAAQSLQSCN